MKYKIEKYKKVDSEIITLIWNEVIDEGLSFFWETHFSRTAIEKILEEQDVVYCAKYVDEVVGFYMLHPNFPGRGNHIANALYAVRKEHRGKGVGKMLGEHSLKISKALGYKAMQYNSIVSINTNSINLWESMGFERIGEIKDGFRTEENGLIDIYIYHKKL